MLIFFLLPYNFYKYFPIYANLLIPFGVEPLFAKNLSYVTLIDDYRNFAF